MRKLIGSLFRFTTLHLVLVTVAIAWPANRPASAQATIEVNPDVPVGGRVRLLVPSLNGEFITGRLLILTPDSAVIEAAGTDTLRFSVASVQQAQVSTGFSGGQALLRGAGQGMLIGGLVTGALVWSGIAEICMYISCLRQDLAGAAGGFIVGLIPGAVVGGLFGIDDKVEEWRAVELIRLRRG